MQTIVLGAGPCGLATAMMLARDGHRVSVLERDPAPVPEDSELAWDGWTRAGVAQFRQAHFLQARARTVLAAELPNVLAAFEDAGGLRINLLDRLPPPAATGCTRVKHLPANDASTGWGAGATPPSCGMGCSRRCSRSIR